MPPYDGLSLASIQVWQVKTLHNKIPVKTPVPTKLLQVMAEPGPDYDDVTLLVYSG